MKRISFNYFAIGTSVFVQDNYGHETIAYRFDSMDEAEQKVIELQNPGRKQKKAKMNESHASLNVYN